MNNKILTFVFLFLVLGSCQKPIDPYANSGIYDVSKNIIDSIPSFDLFKVNSNISVQVFDNNKKPISFATVICGNTITTTDSLGYALFEKVDVSQNNGAIIVKKEGYFNCTRTFVATQNEWHFLKVILNEHNLTSSFSSDLGGLIKLSSGAIVNIPGNGLVVKGTNTVYKGLVNAYTHWLDPSNTELMSEVQGDLRGIDTNGVERAIQTFGMINVELKGANN